MSAKNKNARQNGLILSLKRQYNRMIMIYNVLSVVLYTLYTFFVIYFNWGDTVYITIILSVLGLYVVLFLLTLIIKRRDDADVSRKLKDYRSGLKIVRALTRVVNFALSVTVFTSAIVSDDFSIIFRAIVLIISLAWTVFQIYYQISRIVKRNNKKGKQRSKTVKKNFE